MSNKMLVTVKFDQHLAMSQQLRQAITLLQYNTLELKQLVQEQLENNPLLETDDDSSQDSKPNNDNEEQHETLDWANTSYSADLTKQYRHREDDSRLENYAIMKSLRDHLFEQTLLCHFDHDEQLLSEAIIDAIDDNGYLTMQLEEIILSIHSPLSLPVAEDILKSIQTFDPIGVGSRNLRECLLTQLNFINPKNNIWEIAKKLITDYFEQIALHHEKKICKSLKIRAEEYSAAIQVIRCLNPHPGSEFMSQTDIHVDPELYVKKFEGVWRVYLFDSILTNIKINKQYQDLIKKNKRHETYPSLKQELDEAKGLLIGIKRRNETLLAVGSYIIENQVEFLENGKSHIKPMNIADIAAALSIHESTVSRITTGKYIDTARGIFELKYFFSSEIKKSSGESTSATAVKSLIKEIIDHEGESALSDEAIVSALNEKGINIARRTVAKYREGMRILPSYQRKNES